MLVTGSLSPSVFHRFADRLEELLPDVQRVEIPDASHIVHEDNPEDLNAAVLAFCGG
ncbi:MAG: alpha/beta hydrolase [Bryobacterales bacterium]